MGKVAFLSPKELEEIIHDAYSRGQRDMVKPMHEAIVRAKYGLWCSTDEALEILNCSFPTLKRKRESGEITYKAEGRMIFYNVNSLFEYIEQLGRRFGSTTTKSQNLTRSTTTTK